jgi:enoyl-CoA hydratase
LAVNFAKQSIERGFDETLPDGLKTEAQLFGQAFETKDHNEGIQAFIGKRPAQFKGE